MPFLRQLSTRSFHDLLDEGKVESRDLHGEDLPFAVPRTLEQKEVPPELVELSRPYYWQEGYVQVEYPNHQVPKRKKEGPLVTRVFGLIFFELFYPIFTSRRFGILNPPDLSPTRTCTSSRERSRSLGGKK